MGKLDFLIFVLAAESPVVQKPPQIPPKVQNPSPQKIYPDEKPLLPKPKTVRLKKFSKNFQNLIFNSRKFRFYTNNLFQNLFLDAAKNNKAATKTKE